MISLPSKKYILKKLHKNIHPYLHIVTNSSTSIYQITIRRITDEISKVFESNK